MTDTTQVTDEGARPDIAPGLMRCAKCKFKLIRVNLNVNVGTVKAGDSKTEPCPNGCGPLWPVTWQEEAREAYATADAMFERAEAAEKALAVKSEPLRLMGAPEQSEDAQLLDWIESVGDVRVRRCISGGAVVWDVEWGEDFEVEGSSLRDALRAARKTQGGE